MGHVGKESLMEEETRERERERVSWGGNVNRLGQQGGVPAESRVHWE